MCCIFKNHLRFYHIVGLIGRLTNATLGVAALHCIKLCSICQYKMPRILRFRGVLGIFLSSGNFQSAAIRPLFYQFFYHFLFPTFFISVFHNLLTYLRNSVNELANTRSALNALIQKAQGRVSEHMSLKPETGMYVGSARKSSIFLG